MLLSAGVAKEMEENCGPNVPRWPKMSWRRGEDDL